MPITFTFAPCDDVPGVDKLFVNNLHQEFIKIRAAHHCPPIIRYAGSLYMAVKVFDALHLHWRYNDGRTVKYGLGARRKYVRVTDETIRDMREMADYVPARKLSAKRAERRDALRRFIDVLEGYMARPQDIPRDDGFGDY